MRRVAGRPPKRGDERAVRRNLTVSPENDRYVLGVLKARGQEPDGNYAHLVNEIIKEHKDVAQFKQAQLRKLKEQELLLGVK